MRNLLLIGFVVMAGCADGSGLDESSVALSLADEEDQGVYILSRFADTLATDTHFRVSVTPVNRPGFQLSVSPAGPDGANGAHLVATDGIAPPRTGADPWFVGMIMSGGGGRQLKIRSLGFTGNATLYFLDYRPSSNVAWSDYCGSVGGGAIALAGYYGPQRIHHLGPWITFSCEDGIARKCHGWGYVAGNAGAGDTNWDHHQACTAAGNADYCRLGIPFTRQETPILLRDFVPGYGMPSPDDIEFPEVFPGNPNRYYFEAAWRPGSLQPICVSRLRWVGLAPEPCPGVLPDPRTTPGPRFCEDHPISELQSHGAILVSASKMMDAPLASWENPTTGDVTETIMGYSFDVDGDSVPELQRIPFDGYAEYRGIDSVILRNLPHTLDPANMIQLYSQHDPVTNDRVVATAEPLPGHTVGAFEGHVYPGPGWVPSPGPVHQIELLPLILCRIGSDYRATVSPPAGSTFVKLLGYALPKP